jgi:histidine kinase
MQKRQNHRIRPLKCQSQGVSSGQEGICAILQEIDLAAARVEPVTADVLEYNGLFSSLVQTCSSRDYRLWFVEGVLTRLAPGDRACWEAACVDDNIPVRLPVAFTAVDGRTANYEMHSVPSSDEKQIVQSIVCIFMPQGDLLFESGCEKHFAAGRESERTRIRNELHKSVSQQLLGAAFGCKVLAGKINRLDDELGKEASDLAVILNQAVVELQNLIRSDPNQN